MKILKIRFQAFTLIELLIIIVIIGILATALIPKITGSQARARDTARMAGMRQMQTALQLYYWEFGKYPGGGAFHYANYLGAWCAHQATPLVWTEIFNDDFTKNYISSLPIDPLGKSADYCYWYTYVGSMGNSSHFCTKKDGNIIDIDGLNTSWGITWPQWNYVLTFIGETDLTDKYPLRNIQPNWWKLKRYCVIPTRS